MIALLVVASCAARPDRSRRVWCGLDVLEASGFAELRGRRVGLITNQTGIDRRRRSVVDLIGRAEGVELVALFSPEHGFDGVLEGKVRGAKHDSGLEIHSLYGDVRKPTAAMLDGIDTLVFDIQDIGCRFYTYVSTMGLAMHAAAEHGLRFVVLDRPNPIGGVRVEGPVLDAGQESFVGYWRIPVRHGMTVGELAVLFQREMPDLAGLDLRVVGMRGWRRDAWFDETGQPWVDPSPNMRNLHEALLYPGVGLLETTNLSVGRGTDTPFERIGAPWIDGVRLAARLNASALPGLRCYPIEFTPTASKFAGQRCSGVFLLVTDRDVFDSVRAGMHLACALRDLFGDAWRTDRYARLLRDTKVLNALHRGAGADALVNLWQRELAEFRVRRDRVLLYRGRR